MGKLMGKTEVTRRPEGRPTPASDDRWQSSCEARPCYGADDRWQIQEYHFIVSGHRPEQEELQADDREHGAGSCGPRGSSGSLVSWSIPRSACREQAQHHAVRSSHDETEDGANDAANENAEIGDDPQAAEQRHGRTDHRAHDRSVTDAGVAPGADDCAFERRGGRVKDRVSGRTAGTEGRQHVAAPASARVAATSSGCGRHRVVISDIRKALSSVAVPLAKRARSSKKLEAT